MSSRYSSRSAGQSKKRKKQRRIHVDSHLKPQPKPVWDSPRPVRAGGPGGKYPPPLEGEAGVDVEALLQIESKVKMEQAANSAKIVESDASVAYIHAQVSQANEMTERYARALNDLNASYQILKGDQTKLQERFNSCQAALKQVKNEKADLTLQLEEAEARIVRSAEAESTARVSNDKLFQDLRKREISLANVKSKHAAQMKRLRELERENVRNKMEKAELADRLAKAEEENRILANKAATERETTENQYAKRLTQFASGEKTQRGRIGAMQDALNERDSRLAEMEDNEGVLREQHSREIEALQSQIRDLEDFVAEVKDSKSVQRDALEAENRRLWQQLQALEDSLTDSRAANNEAFKHTELLQGRLLMANGIKQRDVRLRELEVALEEQRKENKLLSGRLHASEQHIRLLAVENVAMSKSMTHSEVLASTAGLGFSFSTASKVKSSFNGGRTESVPVPKRSPRRPKRKGGRKGGGSTGGRGLRSSNALKSMQMLQKRNAELEAMLQNRARSVEDVKMQRDQLLQELRATREALEAAAASSKQSTQAAASNEIELAQRQMLKPTRKGVLLMAKEGIKKMSKRLAIAEEELERVLAENTKLRKRVKRYAARIDAVKAETSSALPSSQLRSDLISGEASRAAVAKEIEEDGNGDDANSNIEHTTVNHLNEKLLRREGMKVSERYMMVSFYESAQVPDGLNIIAYDSTDSEQYSCVINKQYAAYLLKDDELGLQKLLSNRDLMITALMAKLQLHSDEGRYKLMLEPPAQPRPSSPSGDGVVKVTALPKNDDSARFIESARRKSQTMRRRSSSIGMSLDEQITSLQNNTYVTPAEGGKAKRRKSIMNPEVMAAPPPKPVTPMQPMSEEAVQKVKKKKKERAFMMKITRQDTFGMLQVPGKGGGKPSNPMLQKPRKKKANKASAKAESGCLKTMGKKQKKKRLGLTVSTSNSSESSASGDGASNVDDDESETTGLATKSSVPSLAKTQSKKRATPKAVGSEATTPNSPSGRPQKKSSISGPATHDDDHHDAHAEMARIMGINTQEKELDRLRGRPKVPSPKKAHQQPLQRQDTLGAIASLRKFPGKDKGAIRKKIIKDGGGSRFAPKSNEKKSEENAGDPNSSSNAAEIGSEGEEEGKEVEATREDQTESDQTKGNGANFGRHDSGIGAPAGPEFADDSGGWLLSDGFGSGLDAGDDLQSAAQTALPGFESSLPTASATADEPSEQKATERRRRRSITADIVNAATCADSLGAGDEEELSTPLMEIQVYNDEVVLRPHDAKVKLSAFYCDRPVRLRFNATDHEAARSYELDLDELDIKRLLKLEVLETSEDKMQKLVQGIIESELQLIDAEEEGGERILTCLSTVDGQSGDDVSETVVFSKEVGGEDGVPRAIVNIYTSENLVGLGFTAEFIDDKMEPLRFEATDNDLVDILDGELLLGDNFLGDKMLAELHGAVRLRRRSTNAKWAIELKGLHDAHPFPMMAHHEKVDVDHVDDKDQLWASARRGRGQVGEVRHLSKLTHKKSEQSLIVGIDRSKNWKEAVSNPAKGLEGSFRLGQDRPNSAPKERKKSITIQGAIEVVDIESYGQAAEKTNLTYTTRQSKKGTSLEVRKRPSSAPRRGSLSFMQCFRSRLGRKMNDSKGKMRFALLSLSVVFCEGSFSHVRCSGVLVGAEAKALPPTVLKESDAFGKTPTVDSDAAEKKAFIDKVAALLSLTSDGTLQLQ